MMPIDLMHFQVVCVTRTMSEVSFAPSTLGLGQRRSVSSAGRGTTDPEDSFPRVTRTCVSREKRVEGAFADKADTWA